MIQFITILGAVLLALIVDRSAGAAVTLWSARRFQRRLMTEMDAELAKRMPKQQNHLNKRAN